MSSSEIEQTLSQAIAESTPVTPYESLLAPCRHAQGHTRLIGRLWQWLVCWPDPYHCKRRGMVVSVYGMLVMLVDMTTDVWIAASHLGEGHDSWSYLAMAFFFLPIIFALGYTVILRGYERWFQVHPVGPFYWSCKSVQARRRQFTFRHVLNGDDATSFVHYTHEVERCEKRYRYSSADECYLEAFPECILQGYFIARLLSRVDVHPDEHRQEVSWSMWMSVLVSAVSLIGFESSVAYNRHYVNTLFEPSKLDIIVRVTLDFMTLLPRLASIACFCTVTPRVVSVCSFIVLHTIVVFIWLLLSSTQHQPILVPKENIVLDEEQEEDLDMAFEDFRGYKKHRANAINHLRATIVSFLFPPTCSWHMLEAQRTSTSTSRNAVHPRPNRSTMQLVRRGSPKQFWMLSGFQFLESGVLFGVWLYYTWMHTHELNQILLPTLSLSCLALRPFFDVVCQMKLLTPLARDEVQNCVRFKGVLAKTRILQVGTDLVNSLAADLSPKLHKLDALLRQEPSEKNLTEIKTECDSIAEGFKPQKSVLRYRKQRSHAHMPDSNKMATSSGPKTQRLMLEVSQTDMEFLLKVSQNAEHWAHEVSTNREEVLRGVRDFINLCQARLVLWERVFVACLNHQYLPEEFHKESKIGTKLSEVISTADFIRESAPNICADYTKLIRWNKHSRTLHTLAH